MSDQRSKVVKITMPYSYANEFIEESRISFYDSRALHLMFKCSMYNAMYNLLQTSDKKFILDAKEEIKQYIKELYDGMDKFYKTQYEMRK